MTMSTDDATNCRTLYEQVCSQHDGIADFRGKLLGLLPIASGAGIFLLFRNGGIPDDLRPHLVAIAVFGITVTTALFFYELRGIQKCNALINAARHLEQELLPEIEGAFRSRPRATWGVGAETAALIVYPTVAGAWAYLAALTNPPTFTRATIGAAAVLLLVGAWAFAGRRVLIRGVRTQELSEIRRLNRKSFLAEDRRDEAMLEPILDDEFRIVRSSGVQQNKKQMLDGLASTARGRRVIRKELVAPCDNDVAVAMTLISYFEADTFVGNFWNTKVFVNDGRNWHCKTWQVARVA
jgi:hypothetical protein